MKKIRTKRGIIGDSYDSCHFGTGCNTEQSIPELYVDDNIRKHRLPPLQRILRFQRQ